MRFTFNGKTYVIEFQREHKPVTLPYYVIGTDDSTITNVVMSKYPFTTVRLVEVDETKPPKEWNVAHAATVGAWRGEKKVPLEKGRTSALRRLTPFIPKEMREPMWLAYTERSKA